MCGRHRRCAINRVWLWRAAQRPPTRWQAADSWRLDCSSTLWLFLLVNREKVDTGIYSTGDDQSSFCIFRARMCWECLFSVCLLSCLSLSLLSFLLLFLFFVLPITYAEKGGRFFHWPVCVCGCLGREEDEIFLQPRLDPSALHCCVSLNADCLSNHTAFD